MWSTILRRDSSSGTLENTILDTIFVVSVFFLCVLILAVAFMHCVLRRRNRQRLRNWTSCHALNVISSSSSPSPLPAFPKDGEYIFYQVEVNPNYNGNIGKNTVPEPAPGDKFLSNEEKVNDVEQGIKSTSCPIHLLVPLSEYPVFLPPR